MAVMQSARARGHFVPQVCGRKPQPARGCGVALRQRLFQATCAVPKSLEEGDAAWLVCRSFSHSRGLLGVMGVNSCLVDLDEQRRAREREQQEEVVSAAHNWRGAHAGLGPWCAARGR